MDSESKAAKQTTTKASKFDWLGNLISPTPVSSSGWFSQLPNIPQLDHWKTAWVFSQILSKSTTTTCQVFHTENSSTSIDHPKDLAWRRNSKARPAGAAWSSAGITRCQASLASCNKKWNVKNYKKLYLELLWNNWNNWLWTRISWFVNPLFKFLRFISE